MSKTSSNVTLSLPTYNGVEYDSALMNRTSQRSGGYKESTQAQLHVAGVSELWTQVGRKPHPVRALPSLADMSSEKPRPLARGLPADDGN
jgi:hypothetical protein